MRSSTEISSVIANAKIAYSAKIQLYEITLERGINKENWNIFTCARNLLNQDLLFMNLVAQNLLCDFLIRHNFVLLQENDIFSELPFNDSNYDII